MAEVEQKIKITTEFEDNSSQGLKKAQAEILDFAKAAAKAGREIQTSLGKGTEEADKKTKGLMASFLSLKTATLGYVAVAIAAAVAIGKVISVISEGEVQTKKFALALENSGIKGQLAVAKFKAFASSIQTTTKYSDGAVVSLGTFFTNAGIGYDKLETATKAAIEYSATFGTTLEQAGDAVAASFNGQARELGKFIPEIKRLSEEQLRAGGAADILIKKFGGSAAQDKNTLMGSLESLKNSALSLAESLGKILMPVINVLKMSMDGWLHILNGISSVMDKITGKKKETDGILGDKEANVELEKQIKSQKEIFKIEQDRAKWKEEHKDDQKIFDDLKKQADAEMGSKAEQIRTEYQQRVDAINKLTAVDKNKRFDLVVQEFQLRGQKLNELYEAEAKLNQEKIDKKVSGMTGMASAAASGNAGGLVEGGAMAMGASSAMAGLYGLVAELVIASGSIPGKIDNMLEGLLEGMAEGVPKLTDYLSGEFLSDLMTKFIPGIVSALVKSIPQILMFFTQMFFTLIKNIPNMLVGLAKGIGSAVVDGIKGIGSTISGWFGGGPSPQEKLAEVMKTLSEDIRELNKGLRATYRSVVSSVSSASGQISMAKGDYASMKGTRGDLIKQIREAGMAGDAETVKSLLAELAATQAEMINKAKEIYDLETSRVTKLYEKKKEVYEKERGLLVDRINDLANLRNSAVDSINKAREAILTGSSTAYQNVDRLRANYKNALSPEARSEAASALAGGLQSQFDSAQNLANSGAISGEEFARVKAGILAELDNTQGQIQSEFGQLIDIQNAQIKVLDAGFKKVTEAYKDEMAKLREALLAVAKSLNKLPQYAQGTNYVPNTGLALLHQGEQVVPRGMSGGNITVNITGGSGGNNKQELVKAIREILVSNQGNFRGAIQKSAG